MAPDMSARFLIVVLALAVLLPAVAPTTLPAGESVPVAGVRVVGNRAIKTYIIRREIPFRAGDRVDREMFDAARARVMRVPGVDFAEFSAVPVAGDSAVTITVFISEKSAAQGAFRIERGYENDMSYGLRMAARNFRGRSETVEGSFALRGGQQYELRWENPWLGSGPRIGLGLRGHYSRYEYVYDDES